MGLGGVEKLVLYQLDSLSRLDVADIALALHAQDPDENIRPSIDVDANNFLWKQSGHTSDPVNNAAHHLHLWSKLGLIVNPICDGHARPQSKQASIRNQAIREKSKHDAVIARQQLRVLTSKSLEEGVRTLEQQKLEKKIKSAERAAANIVPASFPELSAAALEKKEITIVKCAPLHCYRKIFFTKNCGQVRGQRYCNARLPPVDCHSSTSPQLPHP